MRVLQIVESFGGGVGRHVVDLTLGLADRGHDVELIYAPARMDKLTTEGLARIQRRQIPTSAIEFVRSPGPRDIATGRELKEYVRRHGPYDIVHGQSSKGGAMARLFAAHAPAAVVYTPHAISTMNPNLGARGRAVYTRIEKWLAGKTHAIICVSPDEEAHLVGLGFDSQRLYVVINGIDLPEARPAVANRKTIGFVGRLDGQKDPKNLVEAFARNADRHPDWQLDMVGYGPLEESAKDVCAAHNIADRVHWLGNQPGEQAMRTFDIFCLPSRYEAMPYVLLEALAAGVPIVTTECGGAHITVLDGENGFIVPIQSPVELAKALDRLMGDDALREKMSEASWNRAHEFSRDKMVEATLKVYDDAIRRRRRA